MFTLFIELSFERGGSSPAPTFSSGMVADPAAFKS